MELHCRTCTKQTPPEKVLLETLQKLWKETVDLQTRPFRTNGADFRQQVRCNKTNYGKHFIRHQLLQAGVRVETLENV